MMQKVISKIKDIFKTKSVRNKILFTVFLLILYRLLVVIPVPFVNIDLLMNATINSSNAWLWYVMMLLWWSLSKFSIISAWLWPFINASIIIQLMTAVIPKLEELTEQGETWQMKIQQYTRYLAFPLSFVQWIWMVYFINSLLNTWWETVITITPLVLILSAFSIAVWSTMLMWIWELITEKGISNWISLLIFASIVTWISQKVYTSVSSADSLWGILWFMIFLVLVLVLLSIFILKSIKEIPVIYSRSWKVQETSIFPIPMNPVWMIPIIFAMAFVSFPYLWSKILLQINPWNLKVVWISNWIESNLNIYTQNPSIFAILLYFIFIVVFTFFYTLITFSPDKISDSIQKKWWYIPWIRPWEETSKHINKILMHLCLWWGIWLALIWIYSYILQYLPFVKDLVQSLWSLPVVVSGSWVIIIVWVISELITKVESELLMSKYDKI